MFKLKIYSLIYFLTFTLILCSCNQKSDELELSLNEKFKFDSINYQNAIKDLTVTGNFESIKNDSSIFYLDTLTKFYSARNFKPVFIKSFEEQDFLYSLLISFNNVKEHGLSPELYHYSTISEAYIKTMYDSLDSNQRLKGLAEIEFLVTDAILKYSYHMRYGVLNPRELYPDSYFLPITDISNRNLFEPLEQDSIIS